MDQLADIEFFWAPDSAVIESSRLLLPEGRVLWTPFPQVQGTIATLSLNPVGEAEVVLAARRFATEWWGDDCAARMFVDSPSFISLKGHQATWYKGLAGLDVLGRLATITFVAPDGEPLTAIPNYKFDCRWRLEASFRLYKRNGIPGMAARLHVASLLSSELRPPTRRAKWRPTQPLAAPEGKT
jgi:hypothetical protein